MYDVRSPWSFDRAGALRRLDDDVDLMNEVIRQFVEDAPQAMATIEGALSRRDGAALSDAAHSLKGAAAYLAADRLCAMAQTLEGFGQANQLDHARALWPAFETLAREVIDTLRLERQAF